ncbi:hypothetical protein P3T39_004334 [Kitasatospora sp. GP82]|nr:hypothetical protein [Kitasatospora sp. GP82]
MRLIRYGQARVHPEADGDQLLVDTGFGPDATDPSR